MEEKYKVCRITHLLNASELFSQTDEEKILVIKEASNLAIWSRNTKQVLLFLTNDQYYRKWNTVNWKKRKLARL